MRTLIALSSMVTAAALLVGCAGTGQYLYRPTEHATATLPENGLPAALYQVPPEQPQGEVKVASLGVHEVQDPAGRHLVVRVVVTNNSDAPWSLDTSRQQVSFPSGEAVAPARAYATVPMSSTLMEIPSRQQRTVDLLFPVPPRTKVTYFRLAWSVYTPSAYVTQYSSFRREDVDPDGYYYGPGRYSVYAGLWGIYGPPYLYRSYWGWGSPWGWYGPRGGYLPRGGYGGGIGGGGGYSGPRFVPPPPGRGLTTPPIYRGGGGFSGGGGGGRFVPAPPARAR